jgi:hypothetical protein
MSVYEPNPDVRPAGAEPDELIDTDPEQRHDDQPGLDTDNLPGDNRPPASARPLRDRPGA